jgi:4-amino-4-deoxy-L-arabinose transferase-like glycosyltransferase
MSKNNYFIFTILILLSFWTLFYRLGEPNFYHLRKESRRAQIAQEMVETDNWLIPRLEGKITLTKPPLYYWSVAILSLKTGVTEFTARVPSAIAGVGTIVLTFLLGSLLFNRDAGFVSAFALIVTNFFMHEARYAEMESMLTFFITGAIFFFFKGYYNRFRSTIWFSLFWLMMGFGMITKGPFALTFPLIPIIGYLWVYKEKKILIQKQFLTGILFFILLTLPWPIAVLKNYPQYLTLIFGETIGRTITGFAHREPFYYYFTQLDETLFPWIFFLPFSIVAIYSKKLASWKSRNIFLLFWVFGNLLFLTLSLSKRDYYLYSITPAIALITGSTWNLLWEKIKIKAGNKQVILKRAVFGAGGVLAGAACLLDNTFAVNFPEMHFPKTAPLLLFAGSGMIAVVCAKALLKHIVIEKIVFTVIVMLMLLSHYIYFTYTVPIRNLEDSRKGFYLHASKVVALDSPLGFYCPYENYAFTFYASRPIVTLKNQNELTDFMDSDKTCYVVMSKRNLKKLPQLPWQIKLTSEFSEHKSWRGYVLLCNRQDL